MVNNRRKWQPTTRTPQASTAEFDFSRTSRTCRCLSSSLNLVATWDPSRRNVHIQVGRQNCVGNHGWEDTVWWQSVRFCSEETPHFCEVEFCWLHCWLHFFISFVALETLTCADGRTWPDVKHFVGEELVTCKYNGDLVSLLHVCFTHHVLFVLLVYHCFMLIMFIIV